jgi:tetratricopeptide (TPR) repeat protein
VYAEADRRDEARAIFDELTTDDLAVFTDDLNQLMILAYLADVCCYLADQPRADLLYEMLLPLADKCIAIGLGWVCTGSASNPLGKLATLLGRFDDAERHFVDAITMNRKLRAPTWVADAQLGYARMLLARASPGDRERARELLTPALATARECGMATLQTDCERLLAGL